MKKIAFVIGTMGNGGAERVIAAISNEMVKKNIKIKIITIYGRKQDYPLNTLIELHPILCKNKIRVLRPFERFKKIRKEIVEFSPDCIISFLADVNIHTIIASNGLHIPLIVCERNDPKQDPEKKWERKLRDILYKKADAFTFQTDEAADYFKKIIPRNKKRIIIQNPLTPGLPVFSYNSNTKRLITACRLNPQKNLKMMIDAVSEVHNMGVTCTLDIFGEGPMREELQQYINEKGLQEIIKLRGFSHNIHEEMLRSVAFIISSDYEGISNSMIEALAIGMPVIATDCPVGGARMYIDNNKTGWLVPVGDRDAFASAIMDVLSNPNKAVLLGQRAMQIRNELDVKKITDQWIRFIKSVIEGK